MCRHIQEKDRKDKKDAIAYNKIKHTILEEKSACNDVLKIYH